MKTIESSTVSFAAGNKCRIEGTLPFSTALRILALASMVPVGSRCGIYGEDGVIAVSRVMALRNRGLSAISSGFRFCSRVANCEKHAAGIAPKRPPALGAMTTLAEGLVHPRPFHLVTVNCVGGYQ